MPMIDPEGVLCIVYNMARQRDALVPGVHIQLRSTELPKDSPYRGRTTEVGIVKACHLERQEKPYEVEIDGNSDFFEAEQLRIVPEQEASLEVQEMIAKRRRLNVIKHFPCPAGDGEAILIVDVATETEPVRSTEPQGYLQYRCPICNMITLVDQTRNIVA